jgi:hypothetical protein
VTGQLSQPRDPSYALEGPARRQPAGPGTRLFEAELGARSAQIIQICVIGAGSDKIGESRAERRFVTARELTVGDFNRSSRKWPSDSAPPPGQFWPAAMT